MKKAFPISLIILGLVFVGAGAYTVFRGIDARSQVSDELVAQNIVTPDDASIPGEVVDDAATAKSMAEIIDEHARQSTEGLTYSEMGRFLAANGDPAGTNDAEQAVIGENGEPVANPLRNVAFQASALRTSLYTSVMAFNIADLVVGLGAMIIVLGLAVGGVGIALASLVIPAVAEKVHVEPVAAD